MTHRYGLSTAELVALSVRWEDDEGYDSIPTVERLYGGECCWPDCHYRRNDPAALWEHAHFGRRHASQLRREDAPLSLHALIEQYRMMATRPEDGER